MGDAEKACSRDDAEALEVEPFELPAELQGRFQGLEPFAQSLQSACYLATQPTTGFRGLLKVIALRDLDASERGRLKRELRKQVKLTHPNLPRIVDGGELTSSLWLLRDHVDGESLGQRLKREGALEQGEALAITAQLASALDELHRAGILHRDVRPSRIVLQPRDGLPIVKLIDAGIATRQRTGAVFDRLGTPAYMSPEQIAGKLVSFRSDLYALGCLLFEMLAGKPPFGAGDDAASLRALLEAHQHEAPPALPVTVPTAVSGLLSAMLEKDPRKRPFSAQQVRRTLDPLLPAGMPPLTGMRASAAGGISAPLAAGSVVGPAVPQPRGSQPGALPMRAGSRPIPPPAAGRASAQSFPREEITDEIELDDLQPPSLAPGGFVENHTVSIPPEELDQLRVPATIAPKDVDPDDAATSLISAASMGVMARAVEHAPESTPEPVALEPSAVPAAAPVAEASAAVAASAPEPQAAAVPKRASVAFDVESLFNDPEPESPAVSAPLPGAPQGPDEDGAATLLYKPEESEAARAAYREAVDEAQNQDRTVVVRAPQGPSGGVPKLWIGAGLLGAAIVLFAMCRSGGHDGEGAAGSAEVAAAEANAKATPADGAEREPGSAAANANAQPVGPARGEGQSAPAAQAAPAVQPAPTEAAPAAGTEAGAANAQAAPAEGATPSSGATAPRGATEEGQAPPARSNRPDAVVGQRASRAERLAKANQLKAEGRAHYQAARYREAARSYEQAAREMPSDGGAFAGLGASLLSANDADGAIRAYQRAVQIDGQSSGFHAALGRAYAMKGDKLRARASYTRALALNPKNGAAQQGLDKLK